MRLNTCVFVPVCVIIGLCLMHVNEPRKWKLYLISISVPAAQRSQGDGNEEKREEMMEGTGGGREDEEMEQLAPSVSACSPLPAQ